MNNKKTKLNIENSRETAGFPGFVIDLRKNINSEIKKDKPIIKEKARLVKKELKEIEYKIKKKADKKINYLRKEKKKINPRFLKFINSAEKETLSFFKPLLKTFKKNKNKGFWLKFYLNQSVEFEKAIKTNFKFGNISKSEKRAKRAEEKLVWYKSIFSFILVLVVIITPLKLLSYFELLNIDKLEKKILGSSQLAMTNLMAASSAISKMDFKIADSEFQKAGSNFLEAENELNIINDSILSLAALSNDPKLKLAAESKKFLKAGAIASALGSNLVLSTDSLFSNKDNFTKSIDDFVYYGSLAVSDAKELKIVINNINPKNLPTQYQEKFNSINKQVSLMSDNLESFVGAGSKFKELLGATRDRRYLLVFQNNSELRASGGFLGSYALVDIRDGKIRNLEVPGGGAYDTEGGMIVRVVAPKPLWLVNPLWHFWDANWWPDWPTTARNLMWFYEKSGGPTVDGVISVTPNVIEGLLEVTGPIDLTKEYGLVIDSNNFWETVQKIVEQKNFGSANSQDFIGIPTSSAIVDSSLPIKQGLELNTNNKPKKIIGDLMSKILEVLPQKLDKNNLIKILALFENNLSEKQVLFYFNDPVLQSEFSNRNWAGEVRDYKNDYLMVVNTNIAGQKSDRKMEEKIDHLSEVAADGSIINTLTITRSHIGLKNEIMTGVRNVDWLRIYVPKGSELLETTGFKIPEDKYLKEAPDDDWQQNDLVKTENEATSFGADNTKVYEENGKTVFANWLMVDPGETETVKIKYRLKINFFEKVSKDNWLKKINNFINPEKNNFSPYSLMIQKQAGAKPSEFKSTLILPSGYSIFWRYPDNLVGDKGWEINDSLNSDKYWSILVENK
ncbi:MAG: DUF4012 domain-containing protein [Patescibacteria group bacterium]